MIYLVIALVTVSLIILFSAGTFDSPKLPSGNFSQGNQSSMNQGNPHSADEMKAFQEIEDLQKQVEANPQNMDMLLRLSHLLNDNGMYEKAIENYERYLKNNPDAPDVLVDLGVCYYNIKDYENAVKRMKQAISIEPKHQIGHFNLGIVSFAQNNITEAKDWWEKTVEIDASTPVGKKAQDLLNTK
jgi:tetratricopeptide (TPR) repeat protein